MTTTSPVSRSRITWNRWSVAARVDALLPQVRGRDRLLAIVRGQRPPRVLEATIEISWGPGLHATVGNVASDGSLLSLYTSQWVRPALTPILEASLPPGGMFVDVGANIGIYTTWAAGLVGPTGAVLAFEPVEQTRRWLEDLCAQNVLDWVTVIPAAVADAPGTARMQITPGASGLSRINNFETGHDVPVVTLDEALGGRRPALVKIDVEGHELGVLRGARTTLATGCPVVFEAPEFGAGEGTGECVDLLNSSGYQVYSLTPKGLQPFALEAHSHNLLATKPDDPVLARLNGARFPRSQNT